MPESTANGPTSCCYNIAMTCFPVELEPETELNNVYRSGFRKNLKTIEENQKHKGPLTNFLSCLDAALFLETVGYEKFLN